MLLQLPLLLNANSAKRKVFENPAIKVNWAKNLSTVMKKLGRKTGDLIVY